MSVNGYGPMSEAGAADQQPTLPFEHETRQPFELSDELEARVDALDLAETVRHAQAEGYGYIYDPAPIEFSPPSSRNRETRRGRGGCTRTRTGRRRRFRCITRRSRSAGPAPNTPARPAPPKVVPNSHLLRRHPTPEEVAAEAGVISLACPAGTITFWNGSIWHGGGTRTIDGERVVLHVTFSRLALRPIENYDFLGEDWLEGKPYEMRVMLGREDFLNKGGTIAAMDKIANTMNWAKT